MTSDRWYAQHYEHSLDEVSNQVKFAKVLFYIGEFQYGINELLYSHHHIEATVIAFVLAEMGLLATK